jgi:uroporphyrinogen decarboxylase
MTPRQRILDTLAHRTPDRVPLDLGGTESSGLTGIAYHKLRDVLGLEPRAPKMFDVYQQVCLIDDDLRDALGIDTVALHLLPREWKPGMLPDGTPCEIPMGWNPVMQEDGSQTVTDADGNITARMPAGGFYFEPSHAPLANVTEPLGFDEFYTAIETFDWPGFADESIDELVTRAETLHATGAAVVFNLQTHLLAGGQMLRGYEQFMMDLLAEPQLAHGLLDRLTAAYISRATMLLLRLAPFIDVVLVNDDLGTQAGPMMSQSTYRDMLLPYQRQLFRYIKRCCSAPLLLHSCGSVVAFLPDLIEAGIDAINPVQVSAAGMDPRELKAAFGDTLTFWGGGCDTQHILAGGSPADVADEVARRMDALAPGGGFIFTQVHNIQPDVPAENMLAMFEAFDKLRTY